jgi:hypothetical protein
MLLGLSGAAHNKGQKEGRPLPSLKLSTPEKEHDCSCHNHLLIIASDALYHYKHQSDINFLVLSILE